MYAVDVRPSLLQQRSDPGVCLVEVQLPRPLEAHGDNARVVDVARDVLGRRHRVPGETWGWG